MFQANEVVAMAGITRHQLREWTARRAILTADVPGRGRGKHALYSWCTILVLRILADLHSRFRVEVCGWSELAPQLRADFAERSFISLYGLSLVITSANTYRLMPQQPHPDPESIICVPLDMHLSALAERLGITEREAQLTLFPAVRL